MCFAASLYLGSMVGAYAAPRELVATIAPLATGAIVASIVWGRRVWPLTLLAALLFQLAGAALRGDPVSAFSLAALGLAVLASLQGVAGAILVAALCERAEPPMAAAAISGRRSPAPPLDLPDATGLDLDRLGREHQISTEDRARLASLVRERTAELEAARTFAEEANRGKALFLANMTHELRNPMHAVLSYAQLGRDANSAAEQRDYFDRIAARGHALLRLLSDLLDLSRLEAGSMSMEYAPHDLELLLRDALQQLTPELRAKRVEIGLKRAPDCGQARVLVDSVRIGQAFSNILANAIRFSPEGGRISIQIAGASLPAGIGQSGPRRALELAISDEGVGIPEGELELIFDKFVQSSKTRTNAGGTGLGLAICRQIVALHDGAVVASNNVEAGATIRVVLPLAASATERGAA